jgi:hypothetical protein
VVQEISVSLTGVGHSVTAGQGELVHAGQDDSSTSICERAFFFSHFQEIDNSIISTKQLVQKRRNGKRSIRSRADQRTDMECVIPGRSVKIFAKIIHCLAKVGDELFLEPTGDKVTLIQSYDLIGLSIDGSI